jgi:hypothetical protein
MSAASKKYEELVNRVGNSEPHYCGQQKRQTAHILIQETENKIFSPTLHYIFKLKCKECGYTDQIFRY